MEILNFIFASLLLILLSSDVTNGIFKIPTQCCICDDYSPDPAKRCDVNRICDNSYITCQKYCETTRTFVGNKWFTSRDCGFEKTCADHYLHTVTTLGCVDNSKGEPDNGTTCYQCCKVVNPLQPHFCLDNPDTNFVTFPVSIPTTTPTKPTSPTTTKATTPTTTPTTTKPTTPTTTPTATTSTTISTTTTSKAVLNTVTCETCLSENCTRSTISTCMAGEEYCMNTIIQHGNGSSTLSKSCASKLECYYDAYIAMKHKPGCGSSSSKTACHYCCKPTPGSTSPCNTDPVPKNLVDFGGDSGNSGNTGTLCEVGRDGNYTLTTCSGSTPQCMNTVVLQTNLTVIKKTCESDILCNEDWWKLTRARAGCMKTSLSKSDAGLVCHYCCKSTNGSACNKEMIPEDVKDIISRVDGNWSKWLSWSNGCTADCKGVRVRVRSCSEPAPGPNGRDCQGSSFEQEDCGPMNCQLLGSGSQAIIG